MRIEKIRFKNINNLKGEHEVDFSKDPLRDAGIFAILGPTGSGKSTLLDVITLSLINKIPRFSKAISKTEIEGNGSVMTHYTDDAYASIDYSTSYGAYTSEWKVQRARTGTLKDHEMHIFDKNEGKYLDLKKSEVPTRNEELIGLNYDQFAKSIILSQGQFSKFLKAGKNERGLLLEKITGTEIYRKIGARVYLKFKQIEKDIEQQESSFEFVEILTAEERNGIEEHLKESTQKLTTFEKSIALLNERIKVKTQITDLLNQKETTEQKINSLLNQKVNIEINFSKLVQYEKISPLRGNIALYVEGKKNKEVLEKQASELEKDIEVNTKDLEKVIAKMSLLVKSEVTEDNFIKVMQIFEKEINQLVFELSSVKEVGTKGRDKIKSKCQGQNYAIADQLAKEKSVEKGLLLIKDQMSLLLGTITASKLNLKSQGSEIVSQINEKNKETKFLTEVLFHSKELEKIILEQKSSVNKEAHLQKQLELNVPKLKEKQTQVSKLKLHLKETRKNKENSRALFKLNDYRSNLVDGEKCPLCGSADHPLSGHTEKEDSYFDKEIKQTELGIEIEEKAILELDHSITQSNTQLTLQAEEKKKLEASKSEHASWFQEQNTKPQDPITLKRQIQKIELEMEALNSGREALDEYKWLSDLNIEFTSLGEIVKRYKEINQSLKEKYNGTDVSADCNQLQDEFTKFSEGLKENKLSLKKIKKDITDQLEKINNLEITLLPKVKQLGFAQIEEVKQSFLTDDQVQKLKHEKENYDKQNISLETEKKTLITNLSKLQKSSALDTLLLDATQEQFKLEEAERNAILKESGANQNKLSKDDENKKKLNTLNKKLDKQKLDLENWELLNRMIGDKTGNKFSNYAQNITLQTLLVHANRRMQNLFSRYLLTMPKSEGELIVIDTYQGNTERGVSTLSGGETFMVSLALALSLSDMASKNVALESLFIDEGFSTLDPEMLDLAMNTLDKIQSESQKTVGIISHVESLKERIAVQIQLERNAQGFSSIHIVS